MPFRGIFDVPFKKISADSRYIPPAYFHLYTSDHTIYYQKARPALYTKYQNTKSLEKKYPYKKRKFFKKGVN